MLACFWRLANKIFASWEPETAASSEASWLPPFAKHWQSATSNQLSKLQITNVNSCLFYIEDAVYNTSDLHVDQIAKWRLQRIKTKLTAWFASNQIHIRCCFKVFPESSWFIVGYIQSSNLFHLWLYSFVHAL